MKDSKADTFLVIPYNGGKCVLEDTRTVYNMDDARMAHTRMTCEFTEVRLYKLIDIGHVASVVWEGDAAKASTAKRANGTRRMGHRNAWTKEMETELKRLRVTEGLPFDLIGQKMGRTMSACSSRMSIINKREDNASK